MNKIRPLQSCLLALVVSLTPVTGLAQSTLADEIQSLQQELEKLDSSLQLDNANTASSATAPATTEQAPNSFNDTGQNANSNNEIRDQIRVLLKPKQEAVISSQISARIRVLKVRVGDRFKKGDKLVEFYCAGPYAEAKIANARLKQARIELQSSQKLFNTGAASTFEVELAKASMEEAEANVSQARARTSHCVIAAPYSGSVVSVSKKKYESAGSSEELMEIIDDSLLTMALNVPSNWITKLKKGDEFDVTVDETGKSYRSRIDSISARIDPGSKTVEIAASLTDSFAELKAGMTGNAKFDLF